MKVRSVSAFVAGIILVSTAGCKKGEQQGEEPAQSEQSAVAVAPPAAYTNVSDQTLAASTSAGQDWLVYGGAYNNQRYSSLDQITKANAKDLTLAWIYQTGIAESFETTPVVAGNTMYLTTPESHVVALNAASGQKLWEFIPHIGQTSLCCGPNNRGVAVWGDKVYVGTLDSRLIALNNQTGKLVWQTAVADSGNSSYSLTMAPLAFEGKIFVGTSGGEFGIRGFVAAYDAQTGRLVWKWHTVPGPTEAPHGWFGDYKTTEPFGASLHRDIAQEKADQDNYPSAWMHGGGGVSMTPAFDPVTHTLFFSVGNPAPDINGDQRPGDNLYTGSLVALDATNGQLRWFFQTLPHDVWNLSPISPPVLYSLEKQNYVAQAGKAGWLYVVDPANGHPVLRSDNFTPQDNLFVHPTGEGIRMAPGSNGGNGWSPLSFSPRTGLIYSLASHQPMAFFKGEQQGREEGKLWLNGTMRILPTEESYGIISAIDVRTGAIKWQRRVPKPLLGGSVVNAGDVLFVGESNGMVDAFDATNGSLLWQFPAGAGVHGAPMTYAVNGIQYVAIAAGGSFQLDTPRGDDVLVFALREKLGARTMPGYGVPRYKRVGPAVPSATRQAPAAPAKPATSPAP